MWTLHVHNLSIDPKTINFNYNATASLLHARAWQRNRSATIIMRAHTIQMTFIREYKFNACASVNKGRMKDERRHIAHQH